MADSRSKIPSPQADAKSAFPGQHSLRPAPGAGDQPQSRWTGVLTLVVLLAFIAFFWNSWLIYPLKLLLVFFHELSHGLAAFFTGGSIVRIEVVAQQGGLCVTRGGSRFLILSAGYLGSLAWGGAILTLASRTRFDRWIETSLGLTLLLSTLVWVRPLAGFGFMFAGLAALGLIAAGLLLSSTLNDLLLKLIGLTSILYAPLDILSDVLARPNSLQSDASQLAHYTGVPTLVWGVVWMIVAVAAALLFLKSALQSKTDLNRT